MTVSTKLQRNICKQESPETESIFDNYLPLSFLA
jgi:hypothetical protein